MQTYAYFPVLSLLLVIGETTCVCIYFVVCTSPAIVQTQSHPLPDAIMQSPLAFDFEIGSWLDAYTLGHAEYLPVASNACFYLQEHRLCKILQSQLMKSLINRWAFSYLTYARFKPM